MGNVVEPNTQNGEIDELTELKYREMCKLVKAYQQKRGKKTKPAPVLIPVGETIDLQLRIKIQKSQTSWSDLINGTPFALDYNGTRLYVKTSKTRALCLHTMNSIKVGGASVYRVFL